MLSTSKVAVAGEELLSLLKDEKGGLMMELGISSISYYKSDSTGFQKATVALRAQLEKVVRANPWIVGRLVSTKEGIKCSHPASPNTEDIDAIFSTSSPDKYSASTPFMKTCKDLYNKGRLIVPDGYTLTDKDRPVTMLTLSEASPEEFSLIFSMSHVIADGRTYYEIYKMLAPGAEVRSLVVERIQTFSEIMKERCGRRELAWADSASTALLFTFTMMCNSAAKCFAFYLDEDRVKKAKSDEATAGGVEYVTTNDILTSGFFNATNARIGMMGYDCRDKLDNIVGDLAGNYVTALVLDSGVFGTPASLRKMYSAPPGTPFTTAKKPLPTFPNCCGGNGNFAMVTNWSSFAQTLIEFEGCELDIHLPIQHPDYCVYDLMIPFSSGTGKKGVMIWTVNADEAGLREVLPLGASVSEKLFPKTM